MIRPRPQRPLSPQVRAEASEWLLRFSEREVDSAGCAEFNDWLRSSPEHVRAYLRLSAFWQEARHLDGKQETRDIEALVTAARKDANIFPWALGPRPTEAFADQPAAQATAPASWTILQRRRGLFAVAATLLAAVGAVVTSQHLTRHIYETRIGEQRTVNLPDGSTVILNADSRVRVRYSDTGRTIDLEAGQALFKVARNASRPFIVRSGDASVRAVGTQFDVYRKSTGTTVTVLEGKVAVTSDKVQASGDGPDGENARRLLIAGEQITIPKIGLAGAGSATSSRTLEPLVRPIEVGQAAAWTDGLLIFDGTPLTDVIQEFNRQNTKPLVLRGASELAQIRISGTFPANGAERITRFLQERFGVVAHETDDRIELARQ